MKYYFDFFQPHKNVKTLIRSQSVKKNSQWTRFGLWTVVPAPCPMHLPHRIGWVPPVAHL